MSTAQAVEPGWLAKPWLQEGAHFIFDLDTWRSYWNTKEEGSVIMDPSTDDPAQWQLLPDSPGYRAAKDGTDLGATSRALQRPPPRPSAPRTCDIIRHSTPAR